MVAAYRYGTRLTQLSVTPSPDRRFLEGLGSRGQLDHEPGAAERGVFQPQLAAHLVHDALTDGEAQARAFVRPLGGEEGVEDAVPDVARHAGPGILHDEPHPALARLRAHLDDGGLAAADRVLRVCHQVDDDLLELLAQAEDG